ncbi:hypothetical protein K8352_00775 [Flavobacteriaceae bacterium F89]|uniref:Uncharacterized protein n=1 Tax=Cerina litoralis TaxID=2874477 RepID=A0AAE3ESB8_9FLAO|nr:hypothetical protein [Cerina litoralis]MCG2459274.1 hypothetical protein [Cerina litoralis]
MGTLKKTILIALALMLMPHLGTAQDDDSYQAFWIHQDPVRPSQIAEYEAAAKKLSAVCKKYNLQGADWNTLASTDFNYYYISPIANFAELDKNAFAPLVDQMGKEAVGQMFGEFDKYYDSHRSYILNLDKKLSYMPDGMTTTPEGKPYRHNTLYHFVPANREKAVEIAQKFKELYTKKGVKLHYRVYRNGFGTTDDYFLVAVAAESPEAYEKLRAETNALLGVEGVQLFGQLRDILSGIETIEGYMRPDLSYSSN